ncbi:MAG TPA: succinylglutamate desuccinylase/aspartoacylase family protein [Longimicrobiales bacterium]|nr:succinylglutamate desuccinylase/aspartoacylase family protein [Longimicrobiales bacterium]
MIDRRPAEPVTVAGEGTEPGRRRRFEVHAARLVTGGWLSMPVEVLVGAAPGPRVWLSGALHGDELDGIEIIRRVLADLDPAELSGSVIAVPIVNVFAFIGESRYLPDRRDLNRSFPGSDTGSLAARIAHLFMREVVAQCDAGMDFHCGSDGRVNLPQLRIDVDDPDALRLADAFAAPVVVHARAPSGSLRAEATAAGAAVLVYEGGQAGRFTEEPIRRGVEGVLRVLVDLGMIAARDDAPPPPSAPLVARTSLWVRAGRSGILRIETELGAEVEAGERMGVIADAFGDRTAVVRARAAGVVVGLTAHPLVNRGDAIAHIAVPD